MAYLVPVRPHAPRRRYMGQLPPGPTTSPWMHAYYARGWNRKLQRGNALRAALSGPRLIGRGLSFRSLGQDDGSIPLDTNYGFSSSIDFSGDPSFQPPIAPSVVDTYSTSLPNPTFNSTPTGISDAIVATPGTVAGRTTNAAGQSVPLIVNAQGIATPGGAPAGSSSSSYLPYILVGGIALLLFTALRKG